MGVLQLSLAVGAWVTGVFGMNLYNGLSEGSGSPDSQRGFLIVVFFLTLVLIGLGGGGTLFLYKNKTLVL